MSIRNFINIINEHTETKKKPVLDNKKTVLKTLHDSIKESKSGIEVTTEIGPESWMSYLLSGDSSDMDSEEIKAADKWQERMEPWFVVSTEGEPFYTNHYNLYSGIPGVFGGNVIEYVMHKSNLNKIEENTDMTVATKILMQLGGSKFSKITGATDFVTEKNGIRFKIPRGRIVQIKLNDRDLYDIKIMKIVKLEVKTLDNKQDVGVENLIPTFEKMTSLYTSL